MGVYIYIYVIYIYMWGCPWARAYSYWARCLKYTFLTSPCVVQPQAKGPPFQPGKLLKAGLIVIYRCSHQPLIYSAHQNKYLRVTPCNTIYTSQPQVTSGVYLLHLWQGFGFSRSIISSVSLMTGNAIRQAVHPMNCFSPGPGPLPWRACARLFLALFVRLHPFLAFFLDLFGRAARKPRNASFAAGPDRTTRRLFLVFLAFSLTPPRLRCLRRPLSRFCCFRYDSAADSVLAFLRGPCSSSSDESDKAGLAALHL